VGSTSNRFSGIGSPQLVQYPNSPRSLRFSAASMRGPPFAAPPLRFLGHGLHPHRIHARHSAHALMVKFDRRAVPRRLQQQRIQLLKLPLQARSQAVDQVR
jgi:hypothetical protein